MTEAEILGKMIDRLQDKGWIQGVIWEEEFVLSAPDVLLYAEHGLSIGGRRSIKGRACLQGTAELCGMMQPLGITERLSAVGDRLAAVIAELFPDRKAGAGHWAAVVRFNDHEDTTFEDVMMVLKHAREQAG